MLHAELSHSIVGAAMKVLNTLKPGLDEKAYENALAWAAWWSSTRRSRKISPKPTWLK